MTPVLLGGMYKCQCGPTHQLVTSERLNVSKCVKRSHISILSTKVVMTTAATATFADFGASSTTLMVASGLYTDVFLLAATECYFYRSEQQNQFCQVLGNVCVLQHFAAASSSCALLDLIQRTGRSAATANSVAGWSTTLPFLSYSANAKRVLESSTIGMTVRGTTTN